MVLINHKVKLVYVLCSHEKDVIAVLIVSYLVRPLLWQRPIGHTAQLSCWRLVFGEQVLSLNNTNLNSYHLHGALNYCEPNFIEKLPLFRTNLNVHNQKGQRKKNQSEEGLIDWLGLILLISRDVAIVGVWLQIWDFPQSSYGLWAGRDLYRAVPCMTLDLGVHGIIRMTACAV